MSSGTLDSVMDLRLVVCSFGKGIDDCTGLFYLFFLSFYLQWLIFIFSLSDPFLGESSYLKFSMIVS